MKKLIYSLAIILIGMTSCTSFDDEKSVTYGDGPAVSINLVTTTDSTFTFTVNPAEGTQYYSYTVVKGTEAEEVSASSVLKKTIGGISEAIVKYDTQASVTNNMRDTKNKPLCLPNTSYVVYAVAANDKGVTGQVASLVVKTTDGGIPTIQPYTATDPSGAEDTVTTVNFTEAVNYVEGKVTASYYQEWGDGTLIPVSAEDVHVSTNGSKVSLSVSNVPAGAYVLYSWTEGAFVDNAGNKCPALNTVMGDEGFEGVYRRLPTESWAISSKYFAPASGTTIGKYSDFKGTVTFPQNIYRNDELLKGGEIKLTYAGSKKTTTVSLSPSDWSVSGNVLTFTMPEAATLGDVVTISIAESTIFDINGNPNEAFSSTSKTLYWSYKGFDINFNSFVGTFNAKYYSASSKAWKSTSATISAYGEKNDSVLIQNFPFEGAEIVAAVDVESGKMYAEVGDIAGTYTAKNGTTYYILTYSLTRSDDIEFEIEDENTMSSTDFGLVLYLPGEGIVGGYDKYAQTIFTKSSSASAKAYKAKAAKKSSVKHINTKANVRNLKMMK